MKNDFIRNGWNTVNPTAEQKDRMRAALQARMNPSRQEETEETDLDSGWEQELTWDVPPPEQEARPRERSSPEKKENRQTRYYSKPAAKKKNWLGRMVGVAAVLALVSTGSLLFLHLNAGNGVQSTQVPQAIPMETGADPTAEATASGDYQEYIDRYAAAIREGWNLQQCAQAGISESVAQITEPAELGYVLRDVDGDDQAELLITNGTVIYDLYTRTGEGVAHVLTSYDRTPYYLCQDSTIASVASGGAGRQYYRFYQMDGKDLTFLDMVLYDADTDPDNPWFRCDEAETPRAVDEETAMEIINSYPHIQLSYTPVSDGLPEETVPSEDADQALLNLYAENIPYAMEDYAKTEEQTFCFYDCDGDGREELLLGAGESVYRILQPATGNETFMDISAPTGEEGYAFLCQGNVFEETSYAQGCNHYRHFTMGDADGTMETKSLDYLYYDNEAGTWYKEAEDGTASPSVISGEEANQIRGAYPRLTLDWKPLSQFPVSIPGLGVEGTTLFEEVFVPHAKGEFGNELESVTNTLDALGLAWRVEEGILECEDPENFGAYLTGVLGGQEGAFMVYELSYTAKVNEMTCDAVALFDDNGGRTLVTKTDAIRSGVRANSVEEQAQFLFVPEETLHLRAVVESFAGAFFDKDINAMESMLTENQVPVNPDWNLRDNIIIEEITGLENAQEECQTNGYATVSVAFVEEENGDSFTYLNLELIQENPPLWKVSAYGLEK